MAWCSVFNHPPSDCIAFRLLPLSSVVFPLLPLSSLPMSSCSMFLHLHTVAIAFSKFEISLLKGGFNAGPDSTSSVASMGYQEGLPMLYLITPTYKRYACVDMFLVHVCTCARVCIRMRVRVHCVCAYVRSCECARVRTHPCASVSVPVSVSCVGGQALRFRALGVIKAYPKGRLGCHGQHVATGAECALDRSGGCRCRNGKYQYRGS